MFERYTDRARRVIVLAQDAARDMGHRDIGTGHLLIALIDEGGGVAYQALTALGITPERVREAVLARRAAGEFPADGHLPFTPSLKRALEGGLREAIMLGNGYIGTEHLLLGLIRDESCTGAVALAGCASLPDVRAKVLELLRGYAAAETARNVTPPPYPALVDTLLPDLPEPLRSWELVITVPAGDGDLPAAPNGTALEAVHVLTVPVKAADLQAAALLGLAAAGAWARVPGASATVRPA